MPPGDQIMTEEQIRAIIAPCYGMFNVATRGDVRASQASWR
jgi:hypothetical protein